jgi:hypothetical protein
MPTINGTITCLDKKDICQVITSRGQSADIMCLDSTDLFSSYGFVVSETLEQYGDATFRAGLLIPSDGLTLSLMDSTYLNGQLDSTTIDGTTYDLYIDSTFISRAFDPISINYSIWQQDSSGDILQGYRFREPLHPQVGNYYANMEAPEDPGFYRIEWLYRKNLESYSTIINQTFYVDYRDGTASGQSTTDYSPYGEYGFVVWLLPTTQTVLQGDTVVFTAEIRGTVPAPLSYLWRLNGTNIVDGGKFSGATTNTLTITDSGSSETGKYEVIVSDLVTSNSAWLYVDP